jgi:hypothetical protein
MPTAREHLGAAYLGGVIEGPRIFRTRNPLRFFLEEKVSNVEATPVLYS